MWAVLAPYLAKLAFSLLVSMAEKSGILNPVEAAGIKAEHNFVSAVQTLKSYPNYNIQKNDPFPADGGSQ